jgi:hypothetical protein
MMNICGWRLLATGVPMIVGIHSASAAPHDDVPGNDMAVHYVQLTGTAFEKMHADLFAYMAGVCRAMGKTPEPIPSGESSHRIVKDVYYAVGGVTTYTYMKTYALQPQSCKLQHTESLEVQMRTAAGICTITPKRKRAVGYCDTRSLIAGKTEPARENRTVKPTGSTRAIAGLKCAVYRGSYAAMNMEQCIARAGSFTGMPHAQFGIPGLLLKTATWGDSQPEQKASDLEATKVETDTRVGLKVLAPHIDGGYEVLDSRSGK